jgi:hypothetical protein
LGKTYPWIDSQIRKGFRDLQDSPKNYPERMSGREATAKLCSNM